jgi:hypothetical protein
MLIAGFSDGTAKAFRLLSAHGTDAACDRSSSGKNAFGVPDNTHFLHAATFTNPASQEAVAFVAARPTTDGCAAVLLIGNNGGRSLFSTSAPSIDLQPWHQRQLPQDYLYPSAMLWPMASKTIITSDSGSCSVEEMDVLTGESALQLRTQCSIFIPHRPSPPRLFTVPNQQWPMDLAFSPAKFFSDRLSLTVACSDGAVYLIPFKVLAYRPWFLCAAYLPLHSQSDFTLAS